MNVVGALYGAVYNKKNIELAVPLLIEALEDSNVEVRRNVICAFGWAVHHKQDIRPALPYIKDARKDEDFIVRRTAAVVLVNYYFGIDSNWIRGIPALFDYFKIRFFNN